MTTNIQRNIFCARFFIIFLICVIVDVRSAPDKIANVTASPRAKPFVLPQVTKWENNKEIKIFREYLRLPSVHPNVDYRPCVKFLKKQADGLNIPISVLYPVDNENPVLVMTWEGSQPELSTIMLNSHMDVVPVYKELWNYSPFAAEMNENGDIFARGAQDMKSNAMQYLGAIRSLKQAGIDRLKRSIHVVFVPDEEVGGAKGMEGFVGTDEFKALNVGFMLDEGNPIPNNGPYEVYYGERTVWQIEFIFHGHSGHASRLFEDTPGEKLSYLVSKFMEYRRNEVYKLKELKYSYGNVTTINLTKIKGGVENNVIPASMSVVFDIRISVGTDLDEFENQINRWMDEAGGNITMNFIEKNEKEIITQLDDSNPFWLAFKQATDDLGINIKTMIVPGASDSRFIRRFNIPALGFSPMPNTIPRAHNHDEYLNANTYLEGIEVYKKIITNLANV